MGSHRKLGFKTDHRVAMLRNMTADLINHGRIVTTVTRAKELRRVAERTITLGKRGDLHARRQAAAYLYDKNITEFVLKIYLNTRIEMVDTPEF